MAPKCCTIQTSPPPEPDQPSSSFQCHYDPLSYSLNFDTTGSGSLLDDEDYYYKFYAFSSRFVATSKPSSSPTSQA
ncbi:hypothetical protein Pint_12128 [Pistacia integerrima]|uniref:Uncharacterized protein n=1 Tax=Pistacia integerrima TaxID=434235 RepID=A0ACC0XM41_9ROSI|nr:hypothetical protein Pint_12128 [Pistacia integerrima]